MSPTGEDASPPDRAPSTGAREPSPGDADPAALPALPSGRLAATALLAGVAGLAGSYLAAGPTGAFPGAPVADAIVRWTPAAVVTFGITRLGDLAAVLSLLGALALVAAGYGLVALAAARLGAGSSVPHAGALLALAGGWLATVAVAGAPARALVPAVAMALVVGLAEHPASAAESRPDASRRRLLELAAGVAAFGALSYVARLGADAGEPADLELAGASRASVDEALSLAAARSLPVPGLDGLVVPADRFFEVDIANINPRVDAADWTLRVTGAVDEELSFTFEALRAEPAEHRFVTLRCVGDSLNGPKMDNALWTGTRLDALLDRAGARGEHVVLRAADGYFVGFPLAALRSGLLAYGMNGEALPTGHGYPVRALVPGHWGEVNVKWLTEIEVTDEPVDGYWEKRGWHGTGPVNTVAKIHLTEPLGGGRVRVGGHAYAGTRGVSAVEVSTDGGATWERATLSEPLPGEDVWRQWVHEVTVEGETRVTARAIESDGTVQSRTSTRAFPSGPSGWVSVSVSPGE